MLTGFVKVSAAGSVELELRRERERLQFIIDGSGLGTWEWDVRSDRTIFNDTWADTPGYSLEDLTPNDCKTWGRPILPAHEDSMKYPARN